MKRQLIAAGSVAVLGLSVGVPLLVSSQGASAENSNPDSSIIDKLSSKFNLNKDEVKKVFEEEKAARQVEREKKFSERLSQLVKDGKITQNQADKIKQKQSEIKTFMESLKDKTPEERRSTMKDKNAELKTWAEQNGIDVKYAMIGHAKGGGPERHN